MEGRVMGIYIKGFKPQDGLYVIKDGVIRKYKGKGGTVRPYELIEVEEPHGRLIDADALLMQSTRRRAMSKPISDPVFDIGRDLQRAYDEGYKQGRYDEKVETEKSLPSGEQTHALRTETHACDLISRQEAIELACMRCRNRERQDCEYKDSCETMKLLDALPSAQPKRKWTPCSNPPKHHRDVLVRGVEAIGNVNVYKVMQWDVDTWRPTNYASSIMWKEWSEI